jgi:predicted ATPase
VRAEVPLDLSNAIARMMVKDRARRMASVRELGIVVERLISGGSDALPEAAPPRVPRAPNKLLGREREMARLRAILQDPETRMVTLSGAGGSGKTRLALAVADATADLFPGGQVFVDLTAVTDHALVLPELARALGVEEDAERPLVTLIAAALGAQPSLIVLDNFEQVLGATPDVTRLSSLAPLARILVTSRFLLRVAAEQDFPVLPLPTPGADEAAVLDNPAVALFLERARARQPGFAVDARELRAVAEICRRLDGLPLAIELAAARARVLRPLALLALLERPLELLGGDAADRVPHQRTLLGTINWSLDLLESEEREMFAALGVFAGGWSLDDAATVLASQESGHQFAILVDRLQSLVERSLVTVRHVEGEVRYGMLETLRERARQLLGARADEGQLLMRHARHFADVAESAGAQLASHRQREAMARLSASHDNMRAALGWAERNDPGLLLRLSAALGQFWYLAGHWQEALSWYRRALAMDAGPSHERASVLDEMGRLEMFLGDEASATSHHREAHATALRTGDDDLCARTAEGLGEVLLKIGDIDQATSVLEDAERLARRAGHATPLAHALTTLATARVGSGAMQTASDLLREALRLAEPEGDAFLLVKIHYYLAGISLLEGELAESRRQCEAGRRAALDASDSSWSCHLEEMAARVSMEEGDLSLAAGLVEHSLTSFHGVGSRSCLPHSFEAVARWLLAARRGGDDVSLDAAERFVLGADTLCERLAITMLPVERALLAQTRARLEAASAKVGSPQRADPSWSEDAAALEALALLREGALVASRA